MEAGAQEHRLSQSHTAQRRGSLFGGDWLRDVDEVMDIVEVVTPPVGRGLRLVDMDDTDSTGNAHVDAGTEVTEVSKSVEGGGGVDGVEV